MNNITVGESALKVKVILPHDKCRELAKKRCYCIEDSLEELQAENARLKEEIKQIEGIHKVNLHLNKENNMLKGRVGELEKDSKGIVKKSEELL